jgi:tetratricopeptide (TPR) repeat protein
MSTLSPFRPKKAGGPGSAPTQDKPWRRSRPLETAEGRAGRMRLRRRLILWSLPAVLLLLLVAGKLSWMVALGDQARDAYTVGNVTGVEEAAARLGFLNLLEPHKAPFARGDARVLAGDYEGARAAFEEALALAPKDSREACQIRVNLVLSLEKLADAATAAGQPEAAKNYRDRMQEFVANAPEGCFEGDAAHDEGQQLRDAQQRAQEQEQRQEDQQGQNQPDQQGQGNQPSQDKQQQLDDKTRDNLQQRQQGDQPSSSNLPPVDKPW